MERAIRSPVVPSRSALYCPSRFVYRLMRGEGEEDRRDGKKCDGKEEER